MYAWEEKAYAKLEGHEEGREEGLAEKGQEIALNLLRKKMPISEVSEVTGLSIEELDRLSQ